MGIATSQRLFHRDDGPGWRTTEYQIPQSTENAFESGTNSRRKQIKAHTSRV